MVDLDFFNDHRGRYGICIDRPRIDPDQPSLRRKPEDPCPVAPSPGCASSPDFGDDQSILRSENATLNPGGRSFRKPMQILLAGSEYSFCSSKPIISKPIVDHQSDRLVCQTISLCQPTENTLLPSVQTSTSSYPDTPFFVFKERSHFVARQSTRHSELLYSLPVDPVHACR